MAVTVSPPPKDDIFNILTAQGDLYHFRAKGNDSCKKWADQIQGAIRAGAGPAVSDRTSSEGEQQPPTPPAPPSPAQPAPSTHPNPAGYRHVEGYLVKGTGLDKKRRCACVPAWCMLPCLPRTRSV